MSFFILFFQFQKKKASSIVLLLLLLFCKFSFNRSSPLSDALNSYSPSKDSIWALYDAEELISTHENGDDPRKWEYKVTEDLRKLDVVCELGAKACINPSH